MRVFVAGATGAIGRPLVRQLLAAGHEVVGMTRSAEKARALEEAGARGVVCDAYDRDGVIAAVADAAPDALVHQLTDIPQEMGTREYPTNNRIRREATPHLLDAAAAAGVRRIVAQSIAFLYAPSPDGPADESAPPALDGPTAETIRTMLDVERAVVAAGGLALRYGFFYGPGTHFARDGSGAQLVRKRRFPIVGDGSGVFSFVHVEDAASATVAALERGEPGVYNVCDDEPAPLREWLPAFCAAVGAPRPLRVPKLVARLAAGPVAVWWATRLRGASNAKAKAALGWAPSRPSWREGFAELSGG